MTYTMAIFETADGNYEGVAQFNPEERSPWFIFLLKEDDEEVHIPLGLFETLKEGWNAAREYLGLPVESEILPRQNGESSDGTPFTPNDRTHTR